MFQALGFLLASLSRSLVQIAVPRGLLELPGDQEQLQEIGPVLNLLKYLMGLTSFSYRV